jgi:hypothetical protein
VLVIYDLLGMNEEFKPKFVKRYENLALRIRTAVDEYVTDVKTGRFPSEDESFLQVPGRAVPRKPATVSAIALAGGCAPAPDSSGGPIGSPGSGDPSFYSSPRKKE